jgi:hypothetical protein
VTVKNRATTMMTMSQLVSPGVQANSLGIRNLKIESKGEITGVLNRADNMGHKGRHISNMGLNHGSIRPVK